jgi:hypothetical protein
MKTWNALIYHCQHCGRVVHLPSDADPPSCCESPMTLAAAETVSDSDLTKRGGEAGSASPDAGQTGYRPSKPK